MMHHGDCMLCPHCQSDNSDTSRFCDNCGNSLVVSCGGCGAVGRPGARFCSQCGTRLGGGKPAAPVPEQVVAPEERQNPFSRHIEEGERKQVTVLFADIRGATELIDALDPEAAMGLLDPALAAMTEAVQRFGGTVNRVQGDGIMALFGAPVASEDHAARACLAAQAILSGVQALHGHIAVRVGMHSGEVVIRAVGHDPSDYDAVGVTAHLAHRIEQLAAPNTACLTGRTALLAHGTVDLELLGPRRIAGIAEPVELFRLISAHERPAWEVRAAAGRMTRFLGRDPEMRQLETSLGRAAMSRGQVVALIAEPGMGKSRLVHEFLSRLPQGYWNVVTAAAMSHGVHAPSRLAADLIRAVLGVDRQHDRAEVTRKLAHTLSLLGLDSPEDAAPLESLLDLPVTDATWNELSPDARQERMLPVLKTVMLRECAIRPLLLLLEDLHWADPQSEALLDVLVDGLGAARCMLLLTSRPVSGAGWTGIAGRSFATFLHLGPLLPEAAHRLLEEMLGRGEQLAPLRARIVEQSDGTPLFIEELARSLIEQGIVVADPPAMRLTREMVDLQLPASVQGVVAARIDQLPADHRRLLQVAAVIGKDVPHDILAATADLTERALVEQLRALQAAEFLYEVTSSAGQEYTFKHGLTQTVAYESMLRRQRRELHARVLLALEEHAADRADELTDTLAEHAMRGEVWQRAVELTMRAGHRANTRSAWTAAVAFFDQALEALSHLPETPQTLRQGIDTRLGLRVALGPLTRMDRVLQVLEEAAGIAQRLGDLPRMTQIDVSRCVFQTILGHLDDAIAVGTSSVREAARLEEPAPRLNASYALAQAHWFAGHFAEAERVLEVNLPLLRGQMRLRSAGTTGSISVLSLVCLSKTYAITGAFEHASELAAEAQAIAAETRKPYDLTYGQIAAGFAHLLAGRAEEAVADLVIALDHCRSGNVPVLIPSVARYLGRAYAQVGRSDEAHDLLDDTIEHCRSQSMVALSIWCGLASGHAHLEGGTHDDAISRLEHSVDLARAHSYRPAEAHGWHLLARSHFAQGRIVDARRALLSAEKLAFELGMRPELAAIATTKRQFGIDAPVSLLPKSRARG